MATGMCSPPPMLCKQQRSMFVLHASASGCSLGGGANLELCSSSLRSYGNVAVSFCFGSDLEQVMDGRSESCRASLFGRVGSGLQLQTGLTSGGQIFRRAENERLVVRRGESPFVFSGVNPRRGRTRDARELREMKSTFVMGDGSCFLSCDECSWGAFRVTIFGIGCDDNSRNRRMRYLSMAVDYHGTRGGSKSTANQEAKSAYRRLARQMVDVDMAGTLKPNLIHADSGINGNTTQDLGVLGLGTGNSSTEDGILHSGNGSMSTIIGTSLPPRVSLAALVEPIEDDLRQLNENLHSVVGAENPLLMAAAEQIFGAGGKRVRPALVFLVSNATAQIAGLESLRPQHWRLAEIIEMIHTASLIHDDVLDESDVRRGKKTVHNLYGTRVAVLAGDFMFAQSSWFLANLDNLEVIKLISQVIRDFANGEIKQAQNLFDCDISLQDYLDKSFYKTASLIAASTRSAAIFSGVSQSVCDEMYEYGMNLGLAFQVVDDILDFTQSSEQLGKPAGSDLAKGNLTAPVLFALKCEPQLRELIDSEFTDEGSLDAAINLVYSGGGIDMARQLARQKADLALKNLECLPHGSMRRSLEGMVNYVLERIF